MFQPRNLLDILVVAVVIYSFLLLLRGSYAAQVMKGLAVFGIIVGLASFFHLETLSWIVERLTPVILIGVIVLFQPELRRGFARLGERWFGTFYSTEEMRVMEEVCAAAEELARKRHGALIVFERRIALNPFIETGTLLNAEVTEELLETIFFPGTRLHDGAVILRGNSVIAAGCILPLATEEEISSRYGTRHRAALGLSRETDALVVVISEETGWVSLAVNGKLVTNVNKETLKEMLALYVGAAKDEEAG
ncbi:MAG: TIGR00159 family protein [Candidatus Hydrogenedentota bacterium]|nr:MAG: TIGR00159 family protein [Candidatus Hydrogenedentota bacterium]